MNTTTTDTTERPALTVRDFVRLAPKITIKKKTQQLDGWYTGTSIPRQADGMRNFSFSEFSNVKRVFIEDGQGQLIWQADAANGGVIHCDIWTGLDVLPCRVAVFSMPRVRIEAHDVSRPAAALMQYEELVDCFDLEHTRWLAKMPLTHPLQEGKFLTTQHGIIWVQSEAAKFNQQQHTACHRIGGVTVLARDKSWSIRVTAHEMDELTDDDAIRALLVRDPREAMIMLTSPPMIDLFFLKENEDALRALLRQRYPKAHFSAQSVQCRETDKVASELESRRLTAEAVAEFQALVRKIDANQNEPEEVVI